MRSMVSCVFRMRRLGVLAAAVVAAAQMGCGDSEDGFQQPTPRTTRQASGPSAADIQAAVDQFRADLGTLRPNDPTSFTGGRREINWDGVPDASSAPNAFPGNFFNGTVAGRARGIVFDTPGTGFSVSANAASGTAVRFGDINANYTNVFGAFSAERIFTPVGSNITDVTFFVPGTNTLATTNGFGAVFTDVDQAGSTRLEFFDVNGNNIFTGFVPSVAGNVQQSFSFLGATFDDPLIARVRIFTGSAALGAAVNDNAGTDLVVMDDFIYGEPVAR